MFKKRITRLCSIILSIAVVFCAFFIPVSAATLYKGIYPDSYWYSQQHSTFDPEQAPYPDNCFFEVTDFSTNTVKIYNFKPFSGILYGSVNNQGEGNFISPYFVNCDKCFNGGTSVRFWTTEPAFYCQVNMTTGYISNWLPIGQLFSSTSFRSRIFMADTIEPHHSYSDTGESDDYIIQYRETDDGSTYYQAYVFDVPIPESFAIQSSHCLATFKSRSGSTITNNTLPTSRDCSFFTHYSYSVHAVPRGDVLYNNNDKVIALLEDIKSLETNLLTSIDNQLLSSLPSIMNSLSKISSDTTNIKNILSAYMYDIYKDIDSLEYEFRFWKPLFNMFVTQQHEDMNACNSNLVYIYNQLYRFFGWFESDFYNMVDNDFYELQTRLDKLLDDYNSFDSESTFGTNESGLGDVTSDFDMSDIGIGSVVSSLGSSFNLIKVNFETVCNSLGLNEVIVLLLGFSVIVFILGRVVRNRMGDS